MLIMQASIDFCEVFMYTTCRVQSITRRRVVFYVHFLKAYFSFPRSKLVSRKLVSRPMGISESNTV